MRTLIRILAAWLALAWAGPASARDRAPAGGWTVLDGCTLGSSLSNDGDSFHVLHQGKEYIFRLYFVDCPEKDAYYPDRVAEQARYFGIDDKAVMKVGAQAAHFTQAQLQRPFRVETCWEDAKGSSQMPRQFAVVTVGGRDLAELLVENGLARIYGWRTGADGEQKVRRLRQLEAKAKTRRVGGWAAFRR